MIYLLIAGCSLCWSLFDTSRKSLSVHLGSTAAVFWLMLLQAPLFLPFLLVDQWLMPAPAYYLPAFVSLVLNFASNLWFVESVRMAPLSLAIPILALTPVFSTLGGWLILHEETTPRRALGILIIVVAIFALQWCSGKGAAPSADRQQVRRGLILMSVVAFLFALTPVFDKLCLQTIPTSEHAFLQCLILAGMAATYMKIRGHSLHLTLPRPARPWMAAAVLFAALALLTQLWAIRVVPVGVFEALKRSFGLVAALGLGYSFFREPITRIKLASIAVIAVGIAVLLA